MLLLLQKKEGSAKLLVVAYYLGLFIEELLIRRKIKRSKSLLRTVYTEAFRKQGSSPLPVTNQVTNKRL